MTKFIVSERPGYTISLPKKIEEKVEIFSPPLLSISSTLIRKRVAKGEPIDYLTGPLVCSFIRERGLYR